MGFAKERAIELEERGFNEVEGGVCLDHLTDACLFDRTEHLVTDHDCVVCGKTLPSDVNAPFAVPLEDLMHVMIETVRHFYSDAAEVLPWDSEERSLIGPQLDTWEVVDDIAPGAFEDAHYDTIVELIVEAIGHGVSWTSWFADASVDSLDYAWDQFAQTAMHQSRMVVGLGSPQDPPARLGRFLDSVLLYARSDLGLVRQLPAGTALYRGRLCEDAGSLEPTSKDLGPAPPSKATANRMSPAGVALFYASGDPQTAIAEIAGHGVNPLAVVGKFTNMRDLRMIDLTAAPAHISPFCLEKREHARMGRFLSSFAEYVTAPVIPDGRQHVEYAPTQLLTEYLRWVPHPKLDGIALPSAQTGKVTYVLFFDESAFATLGQPITEDDTGLMPSHLGAPSEPLFVLDPATAIAYRVERQYSGIEAGPLYRPGARGADK